MVEKWMGENKEPMDAIHFTISSEAKGMDDGCVMNYGNGLYQLLLTDDPMYSFCEEIEPFRIRLSESLFSDFALDYLSDYSGLEDFDTMPTVEMIESRIRSFSDYISD
jgi:hypothetical protein